MKYKKLGYTIEVELPQDKYKGFLVECTYRYDGYRKSRKKYALSMWIKKKDIDDKFKIESQHIDTQYITATKENIIDHICRIVDCAANSGYFDDYVERYNYTYKCFDKGSDLIDLEVGENNV